MTTFLIVLAIYMFIGYGAMYIANRSFQIQLHLNVQKTKDLDPFKANFIQSFASKFFGLLLWPLAYLFMCIASGLVSTNPELRHTCRRKLVEVYGTKEILLPDYEADAYGDYD